MQRGGEKSDGLREKSADLSLFSRCLWSILCPLEPILGTCRRAFMPRRIAPLIKSSSLVSSATTDSPIEASRSRATRWLPLFCDLVQLFVVLVWFGSVFSVIFKGLLNLCWCFCVVFSGDGTHSVPESLIAPPAGGDTANESGSVCIGLVASRRCLGSKTHIV